MHLKYTFTQFDQILQTQHRSVEANRLEDSCNCAAHEENDVENNGIQCSFYALQNAKK